MPPLISRYIKQAHMADNTPSHDDEPSLVVKFKDGFQPPIPNTHTTAQPAQNLTIPKLPQTTVDYSALEQWAEQTAQYQQNKERQDSKRFWLNFWLSISAFIVALASLMLSLL